MKTVLDHLKSTTVVGTGSIGSYLCDSLLKGDVVERLKIYEPDVVDERNLRNTIYKSSDIGKLKIEVLEKLFRDDRVTYYPVKYDERYKDDSLIIDCTDDSQEWSSDLKLSLMGNLLYLQTTKSDIDSKTVEYFIDIKKSEIMALVSTLVSKLEDLKFLKSCLTNKKNCFITTRGSSKFQDSVIGPMGKFTNFYEIFVRLQDIHPSKKLVFHINTETENKEIFMIAKSLQNQEVFYKFLNELVKKYFTSHKYCKFYMLIFPDDSQTQFDFVIFPLTSTA